MAFPGKQYAPPGVYTQTKFENPVAGALDALKIPVFIGEGNEYLTQTDLQVVRGSSATQDIQIVGEDETGRAVQHINDLGVVTLGAFDGVLTKFQVRNFPVVDGSGKRRVSNNRADVSVTLDNQQIVVLSLDGARGIVELAQAPKPGELVRCTYYFDRNDTLITDDVSAQVTPESALLRGGVGIADVDAPAYDPANPEVMDFHGDILNVQGQVVVPANNILNLTVDGVALRVTITPKVDYTMAQAAAVIANGHGTTTLSASRFTNNFGKSALALTATADLVVNDGPANALLGLSTGQATTRTRTFYTYNGPIVTGDNSGTAATMPSDVMVKVNNVQVIPTSLDGQRRAVTLAVPPPVGATVTIRYYFNTWQDTFDYLAHTGVVQVTLCGNTNGRDDYHEGADFVLKNDRIYWGTSFSVTSGINTSGKQFLDETQILASLIDNKTYLSACTPVLVTSGSTSVPSTTVFQLPMQPTLGNGRDTPLGQSLFQTIANDRIDLPVDRPDVVVAYWGWSPQDALVRGPVTVVKVDSDSSTMTLKEPAPVGATVYATFNYNLLTDTLPNGYIVTCLNPGLSGVGTYGITAPNGSAVYGATFNVGTKGAGLLGITIEWPSGSEITPDLRFEATSGTGPVGEVVTVQFESREEAPAKFTTPGFGPYEIIEGQSDHARIKVDSADLVTGTAGVNLSNPSTFSGGFFAEILGEEINYTGGGVAVVGQSYVLDTDEEIDLVIDGTPVHAVVPATASAKQADYFVDHINEAASGHTATLPASASNLTTSCKLATALATGKPDGYYTNWVIVFGGTATQALIRGVARTITGFDTATGVVTFAVLPATTTNADPYYIYNPAASAEYAAATKFDGSVTVALNKFDRFNVTYTGDTIGAVPLAAVTLTPGTYSSAADLAVQVTTQLDAAIAAWIATPHADANGLRIICEANADGQLVFRLQLAGVDNAGFIAFLTGADPLKDFSVLAGIDTGASVSAGQTALVQGPVAKYISPAGTTLLPYDRIQLRNRIKVGGRGTLTHDHSLAQTGLEVRVASGNTKAGLVEGTVGVAGYGAIVQPASLAGAISLSGGQDGTTCEPVVTFYDGSGANPANDELKFTVDGYPVTVNFTASGAGTATQLGPVGSAGTILKQIADAINAIPGAPLASAAVLLREGSGFRLVSQRDDSLSGVEIGDGSANPVLGLYDGTTAVRSLVAVEALASALNNHRTSSFSNYMLDYEATTNHYFADEAIAGVVTDETNAKYLFLESLTVGTASSLLWASASARDIMYPTTGLGVKAGDGSVGDAALNGFFVTSNVAAGSGSADTSVLNNGTGQDGIVGQTYRDDVTGLTFTILPRGFSTNPRGPWLAYPTGGTATFRLNVSPTFACNANIPHNAIPGLEMRVTNTVDVGVGDTAVVQTYERGGLQPDVGDIYYVSYVYEKQDFSTAFFTKMSSIEQAYGTIGVDAPVSLAAYLSILNGAVLVGIKQVPRAQGSAYAALTTYRDAITELEGTLPGQVKPDMITPLRGDSTDLYQILARSCDIQSSIRYRSERTSIFGLSAGKTPDDAGTLAELLGDARMRMVYPDTAVIRLTDEFGNAKDYLVDGPMVAAAMTGSVVSPNVDVATPWTGRKLVGFTQLGRKLDAVEMNNLAQRGVTILEEKAPFLRVRHGLTTDMSNILTKTPTIVLIADEVQRQARVVLESFIGMKFLPGILTQVEGRLAMMFKGLVMAQIIAAYTGIKATVAPDDPTVAEVEAYYQPVFPLLYLVLTFHLRSSL